MTAGLWLSSSSAHQALLDEFAVPPHLPDRPMLIEALDIPDAKLITPQRFSDNRGWFNESWSAAKLSMAGLDLSFVQDNLSYTKDTGTLRGLHCQLAPFAQGKLISVVTGSILDVIVDIRTGSPSFGQSICVPLDEDKATQLWVPPGFLHGFLTLSPDTRVLYKVTAPYSKEHDRSVLWNDPALAIDWGIQTPILSDKDAVAPLLKDSDIQFD